jgi:hypothetical protein
MARYRFGGGPQDVYMFEDTDGDLHAGGGFNAFFFDGPDPAASAVTDLLDEDGNATTYITTSDGSTAPVGPARGQLPIFWGPDEVYELWVSINGSPRVLMTPNNTTEVMAPVKLAVDNLLTSGNPNPLNIAFGALIGIDSESIDTAPVGSTIIKQVDGTYGAGGAPIPLSDTIWVAASDAPGSFSAAAYLCDGVADNVQIQAALDNALGMKVGLSPGTFNIATPVVMSGPDNATLNTSRHLFGCGNTSTKLVVGSGVLGAINLTKGVSAHIYDMQFTVTGASRAIYSSKTTTVGAEVRGFYNGSIRRVNIIGPNDGTHSQYAISLKSALQFTVEDVLMYGVIGGIEIVNEDGGMQGGYGMVRRCHVLAAGTGATGFRLSTDAGVTRNVTFQNCSVKIDPVYTNTRGWNLATPSGLMSGIKVINGEVKGAAIVIRSEGSVYECEFDVTYANIRNGAQAASTGGYGHKFRFHELEIEAGATTTLISDTGGQSGNIPNEYDVHVYAISGTTTNVSLGTALVTRGVVEGTGTVANALRVGPNSPLRSVGPWTMAGSLSGKVGAGVFSWYNDTPYPVRIRSVRATVGTAPTGASIIVDVNISGTTAFTTQANRPTIAAAATTSGKVTNMDTVTVPVGGRISVDIDQVGSTVAGADLIVQVEVS